MSFPSFRRTLSSAFFLGLVLPLLLCQIGCFGVPDMKNMGNGFLGRETLPGNGTGGQNQTTQESCVGACFTPGSGTSTGNAVLRSMMISSELTPYDAIESDEAAVKRIHLCVNQVTLYGKKKGQEISLGNLPLVQNWISISEEGTTPFTQPVSLPDGYESFSISVTLKPLCEFETAVLLSSAGGGTSANPLGGGETSSGTVKKKVSAVVVNAQGTSVTENEHAGIRLDIPAATLGNGGQFEIETQPLADALRPVASSLQLDDVLKTRTDLSARALNLAEESMMSATLSKMSPTIGQAGGFCLDSIWLRWSRTRTEVIRGSESSGTWVDLTSQPYALFSNFKSDVGAAEAIVLKLAPKCAAYPGVTARVVTGSGTIALSGSTDIPAGEALSVLGLQTYVISADKLFEGVKAVGQFNFLTGGGSVTSLWNSSNLAAPLPYLPIVNTSCADCGVVVSLLMPGTINTTLGLISGSPINGAEFHIVLTGRDASGALLTKLLYSNRSPFIESGVGAQSVFLNVEGGTLIAAVPHLTGWGCNTAPVSHFGVDIRDVPVKGLPSYASQNTHFYDASTGELISELLLARPDLPTNQGMYVSFFRPAICVTGASFGASQLPGRMPLELSVVNTNPGTSATLGGLGVGPLLGLSFPILPPNVSNAYTRRPTPFTQRLVHAR